MEPKLLKYGVVDMAFGGIIYSLEFYQWSDFLEQWKEVVYESFGHKFVRCKNQTDEQRMARMFNKAEELKNEVLEVIQAFKSVKDDITSLKQSISHLSSLVQDSGRVSIVRGVSILNNEESKHTSDDEFASFTISPEVSHHEIVIRKNICKLKRDISRKIMNNQHLKKIINDFPQNPTTGYHNKSSISVVQGTILNLDKIGKKLSMDDLEDQEVLERLESNLNSLIPTYENTSILTENKSSIHFPEPQKYENNIMTRNFKVQPDALKKRLNSDIQKCQFYENLYCHMKQNSTINQKSPDSISLDVTGVETARFGKSQDHGVHKYNKDFKKVIRNSRQRPSNYKPPRKKSTKRKSRVRKSKIRASIQGKASVK